MIPDFTESEIHGLRETLARQFNRDVEIELTQSDVLVDPADAGNDAASGCPTIAWYTAGANYIVSKIAAHQYRARFYITPHEQYDTDEADYGNLADCLAALLEARKHQLDKDTNAVS